MRIARTPEGKIISFLHSGTEKSNAAYKHLTKTFGQSTVEESDIVVALGGDGFLLSVLAMAETDNRMVYGMNRGTVGFLLNPYNVKGLPERLDNAVSVTVRRLKARVTTASNEVLKVTAFNDVALFRATGQSAHIRISINDVVRLEELVCDGVLVSTPAGSTAYNLSAHGPILPLRSSLLAMTPISAFRPRRWPGALLDRTAKVRFDVLDYQKRPVVVTADSREVRDAMRIEIESDPRSGMKLLFDDGFALEDRILREQFVVP